MSKQAQPENANPQEGQEQVNENPSEQYFTLQHAMQVASKHDARVMTQEDIAAIQKEARAKAFPEFAEPFDKTIAKVTGVEKKEDEKSKEYAQRALAQFQEKLTADKPDLEALRRSVTEEFSVKYSALEEKYQEKFRENEELRQVLENEKQSRIQERNESMFARYTDNMDLGTDNANIINLARKQAMQDFFDQYEVREDDSGVLGAFNKKEGRFEIDFSGGLQENGIPTKPLESVIQEFLDKFSEGYRVSDKSVSKKTVQQRVSESAQKERYQKWLDLCAKQGVTPYSMDGKRLKLEIPGMQLSEKDKEDLQNATQLY